MVKAETTPIEFNFKVGGTEVRFQITPTSTTSNKSPALRGRQKDKRKENPLYNKLVTAFIEATDKLFLYNLDDGKRAEIADLNHALEDLETAVWQTWDHYGQYQGQETSFRLIREAKLEVFGDSRVSSNHSRVDIKECTRILRDVVVGAINNPPSQGISKPRK